METIACVAATAAICMAITKGLTALIDPQNHQAAYGQEASK